MMRNRPSGLEMVLASSVCALAQTLTSAAQERELTYRTSTSDEEYALGEPVDVTCIWENLSDHPIRIRKWRGPLLGVSVGPGGYDFAVYRLEHGDRVRLERRGVIACGGEPKVVLIPPKGTHSRSYAINSAYDLAKPGTYLIHSAYRSFQARDGEDVWNGTIVAQEVTFSVRALDNDEFGVYRERISRGDHRAVAVLLAHGVKDIVEPLSKLAVSKSLSARRTAYQALLDIATDESVQAVAEAALQEPHPQERYRLVGMLGDSSRQIVVPYLKQMLERDPWISCWAPRDGKLYGVYPLRLRASAALARLGVKAEVPQGEGVPIPTSTPEYADLEPLEDRYRDPMPQGAMTRFGTPRLTHPGSVRAVAFAEGGKALLSGGEHHTICVWDADTGFERRRFEGSKPGSVFVPVLFSPNRQMAARIGRDGNVEVMDVNTGAVVSSISTERGDPWAAAFSPDGQIIATGSYGGEVALWSTRTGEAVVRRDLGRKKGPITALAFSPDGKHVAFGAGEIFRRKIVVWTYGKNENTLDIEFGRDSAYSLRYSCDGKLLTAGDGSGGVSLWDAVSGRRYWRRQLGKAGRPVRAVSISPDASLVAAGDAEGRVHILSAQSGEVLDTLVGHVRSVHCLDFSTDGCRLASCGWGSKVAIWDVATGQPDPEVEGHLLGIRSVAFSPDGRFLVSGGADKTIRLWEAATGRQLRVLRGHVGYVNCVVYSPDGALLASCGDHDDKSVRLWTAKTGKPILVLEGHEDSVTSVVFSPDGKTVVSGSSDATIRVWDVSQGQEVACLECEGHPVSCLALSPDGRLLASGEHEDGVIVVWDIPNLREKWRFEVGYDPVTALLFAADGRTLVSGHEHGNIRLWDCEKRTMAREIALAHYGAVKGLSISPDGRLVASAGMGLSIRIWDAGSFEPVARLNFERKSHAPMAFSPRGGAIASVWKRTSVILWDLTPVLPEPPERVAPASVTSQPASEPQVGDWPDDVLTPSLVAGFAFLVAATAGAWWILSRRRKDRV